MHEVGNVLSPWLTKIKEILDKCGMSNVFVSHNVISVKCIRNVVSRNLQDQWVQLWQNEISDMSSCKTYNTYKREYCLEKYIIELKKSARIIISKFRCNNTQLPIVTGRYKDTPRHNRKCPLCSDNALGDEYHLVLECSNEKVIRTKSTYFIISL